MNSACPESIWILLSLKDDILLLDEKINVSQLNFVYIFCFSESKTGSIGNLYRAGRVHQEWGEHSVTSTCAIDFLPINVTCGMQRRRPPSGRNVLSQPFFRILTPAADELTGYHLTVTTRDSCSLPFAGPARTTSPSLFLSLSSARWPTASKKPRRFHVV